MEQGGNAGGGSARHDAMKVLAAYDTDGDGKLDAEERAKLAADYAAMARGEQDTPSLSASLRIVREGDGSGNADGAAPDVNARGAAPDDEESERHRKRAARMEKHVKQIDAQRKALEALRVRYDSDGDGSLSNAELDSLEKDIETTDTWLRYLGYTGMLARTVKYGRVVGAPMGTDKRLLRATFFISWGYVAADVIFEADKAHHVHGEDLPTVVRGACQRFMFQSLSSIVFPFYTLRHGIGGVRTLMERVPAAPKIVQRLGPAAFGVSLIPLMPFIWDTPSRWISSGVFSVVWPRPSDDEA